MIERSALDATVDPSLRSWVSSANRPESDFPIQNLPFAAFRRRGSQDSFRIGVAIGDHALDLSIVQAPEAADALLRSALDAARKPRLNELMGLGRPAWRALRVWMSSLLCAHSAERGLAERALVAQSELEFELPAVIGDYTDFYSSIHHATAVGRLFRPDNPLLPNYHWLPVGYHGRSSSIGISGQGFPRPVGQFLPPGQDAPIVGACRRLDYEVELGLFVGPGNPSGRPIGIRDAEQHIFGVCLLNDWSARDIQAWEYQPLGPFLAKNFATTLSPWVVTLDALAAYRAPPPARATGTPLPQYLDSLENRSSGGIDIQLETSISTESMRAGGLPPRVLTRTSYRHAYWTAAQLVAHHTVNGCPLRPGDLLGSGTQSGPDPSEAGSLIELTSGGNKPLTLPGGEKRTFLEDGDEVVIRGWCHREGLPRIGFGEVRGRVLPLRL